MILTAQSPEHPIKKYKRQRQTQSIRHNWDTKVPNINCVEFWVHIGSI